MYLHKGRKEREVLPKKVFEEFERFIWSSREELLPKVDNLLAIEWIIYEKSICVIISGDANTTAYVKNLAATFGGSEGIQIRAWAKWNGPVLLSLAFLYIVCT